MRFVINKTRMKEIHRILKKISAMVLWLTIMGISIFCSVEISSNKFWNECCALKWWCDWLLCAWSPPDPTRWPPDPTRSSSIVSRSPLKSFCSKVRVSFLYSITHTVRPYIRPLCSKVNLLKFLVNIPPTKKIVFRFVRLSVIPHRNKTRGNRFLIWN